ncbi:scarecrow-like protein 14 [Nicotiana tabacum]|uniref:GRAS1 n=2 Tax=Nicotiana TaxID=4085 RepID=Q1PCS0_TOBAC|nr:scarecrow-like protein 14 [Nicotiana tabacum]XP_009774713.1 PREDICTED: scarecrow-like protein 14 [Nicotiana sylvestris]XP_016446065.1 PREDICTED: scarecrow-like protein 14 [Nicotiana tabacum]ABE02823.1 GRAS1 [Nicotiana tabacum]
MEAIFQEQLFPGADAFIFRHPSSILVDPREDHVVQNGTIVNRHSFEDYSHVHSNVSDPIVRDGDSSPKEEGEGEGDHSDAMYKYISQMLMEEEDLEYKPCMFHDCMALQAAEKYFSDVLHGSDNITNSPQFSAIIPQDKVSSSCPDFSNTSSDSIESLQWDLNFESPVSVKSLSGSLLTSFRSPSGLREKKNHHRQDDDQQRSNKQLATFAADESEPLEMYDNVLLLCPNNPCVLPNEVKKPIKVGRPRSGGKKHSSSKKEIVDLRGLLTQCAQAMSSYDTRTANELLMRIRQHSSSHGDGTERLAHYLANALEARLSSTGTASYTVFASSRISAAHILKAYKAFITACPFKLMSNIFANKYIKKLITGGAPRTIHIIDFGILYGFQWPCLIQSLSALRRGEPIKLRITGVELPQPGFRPAERVEDTGRRLKKYCDRFHVPFEFNAIAKKWESITLEELAIDRDEVLVVNSLYRLGNIPDETVVPTSPRDVVLDLIRRIRPDMFIHGVVNGTYNTPFFLTRFREALFHFSTLFDMFEATMPREDEDRKLFEEEVFARDAMNVIACEGTERVERPETYKQWQLRCARAGFKQLPLDQEIVNFVSNKVRREYHKDFSVDEDSQWMLQGWKGRVVYALSCWKPAEQL